MNREMSPTEIELLDEQLVAYLDGELDDATARALEERMARDTQVRDRLRELSGSWDLLDALPRATLDDKFAHTTVEMVSLAASQDLASEQRRTAARKRRRWMLGAICALAAAMIGFAAFMFALPNANAELLADLPLVENLDAYDAVDSVDFIRQLHSAGVFGDEAVDLAVQSEGEQSTPPAGVLDDDLGARRERLLAMDATQKQELRRKFDRFQAFPEEKKAELRKLDQELRSDQDADRLLETLRQYHGWLLMHSPLERSDLQKMPADARLARIRQLKRDETDRLVVGLSDDERKLFDLGPLTDNDLKAVFNWSHETVLRQKDEILRDARGHERDWVGSAPDKQEESRRLFMVAMRSRGGPPKVTDIPEADWDELLRKLSPATQSELAKEEEKPKQAAALHRWVVGTMQLRMAARASVTREQLIETYNELDQNVQRAMADLPPEDFYRRLWREHMLLQGEKQGPWMGPGRGKPGGPPGPSEFSDRRRGPPREDGDRRDGEERGRRDKP